MEGSVFLFVSQVVLDLPFISTYPLMTANLTGLGGSWKPGPAIAPIDFHIKPLASILDCNAEGEKIPLKCELHISDVS